MGKPHRQYHRSIFAIASSVVLLLSLWACGPLGSPETATSPVAPSSLSTTPITTTHTTTRTVTMTTTTTTTGEAPSLAILSPIAPQKPVTPTRALTATRSLTPTRALTATATRATAPQTITTTTIPTTTPAVSPPPDGPIDATIDDVPVGYVNNGGNFRAGRGVGTAAIGQVCPGDRLALLEETDGWYRARPRKLMADCVPDHITTGTEGWLSSDLVTLPEALPDDYPEMPAGMVSALVSEVIDGQTIQVTVAGISRRVRLIGVDAPNAVERPDAPAECFGAEAAEYLQDLLDTSFVLLETDESQGEQDRFGQLLAYVWLPGGRMANYEMIAGGYAFNLTFNLPYTYQDRFDEVKIRARQQERGLWSPETCDGKHTPLQTAPPPTETLPPTIELGGEEVPQEPTTSPLTTPTMPITPTIEEPTLQPPPAPAPPPLTPLPDFDYNGDGAVTCADFTTCDEAFEALDAGYSRLDDNHDGIPCENVCN